MKTKPTPSRPVMVYKIRHVWSGMFTAEWTDLLNYPRTYTDLRAARPEIAAALNGVNP